MSAGASAEEVKGIKDMQDDVRLADLVKEASCHEWRMTLMAKTDYNNGEAKVRYQVVKVFKIDGKYDTQLLLKMLNAYDSN